MASKPASASPRIRPVPAVRRATALLEHLAAQRDARGLSQLARELGMLPSTCLHILRELAAAGLVMFDAVDKTYVLGPAVLTLAHNFLQRDSFAARAQPLIDRIAHEHGVCATASVHDGQRHIVVVATTSFDDELQVQIRVGRRVPMLASSTGRCIAAFNGFTPQQLRAAFTDATWQQPLSFEAWLGQVEQVRRDRIAVDEGWYRKGITLMSAPVFAADGTARQFVGLLVISAQLNAARKRILLQELREAAVALTAHTG